MLACFASGSGLDARGGKRLKTRVDGPSTSGSFIPAATAEEEERVHRELAALRDRVSDGDRGKIEEVVLGAGANGIAFVAPSPRVSVAFEGDVAVYFRGDPIATLGDDAESPAHEILRRYGAGRPSDPSGDDDVLNVSQLPGSFAILLFDKLAGKTLAARDARGGEALFWGTKDRGRTLLFGSDLGMLERECADADAFPVGTLFVSKSGELTGELTMLMGSEWGTWVDSEAEEEETDFLVGYASAAASAERRWHNATGGLTAGLGLNGCNRQASFGTLQAAMHGSGSLHRIDSNASLQSLESGGALNQSAAA